MFLLSSFLCKLAAAKLEVLQFLSLPFIVIRLIAFLNFSPLLSHLLLPLYLAPSISLSVTISIISWSEIWRPLKQLPIFRFSWVLFALIPTCLGYWCLTCVPLWGSLCSYWLRLQASLRLTCPAISRDRREEHGCAICKFNTGICYNVLKITYVILHRHLVDTNVPLLVRKTKSNKQAV